MTLRLNDTWTRTVRDFAPLVPGQVTMYLCGATVQAPPHIGHIRSGITFDILRRWLMASGYQVTFCRNVTDIDDKILAMAAAEGVQWWEVAERNQRAFSWAYDVLGCLPPTVEPRATGHVPEMIVLMRRLIEAGHAYAEAGDVYFDVRSHPAYGTLSGQKPESMQQGETEATGKRDALDFTLWKGAKPGEPSWETPWGDGRPGWHLECSAMATKYMGAAFDIHGGGLDLVFPHHENEIAQSNAAGDPFAQYWVHNGLLTLGGEKMSKSIGNSLLVTEMVKRVRPVELRYYLGQAHYRSSQDYSETALDEAAAAYQRIEGFTERAAELVGEVELDGAALPDAFVAALDDDLGVPQALAVLHGAVREGNSALAEGDKVVAADRLRSVRTMLNVLGLDPVTQWSAESGGSAQELHGVVDALVAVALEQRAAARARKDFAAADEIRSRLVEAGVVVEDTPAGARWQLRSK